MHPGHASPSCSPETMSPAASDSLPAASLIVSQWQQLASMDQQSPDFRPLITSLIARENRTSTMKLSRADAKITLNIMDKVFGDGKISREHTCDTICTMRKLAYSSGQVPARYQVNRQSLSVEEDVIACGAFADVRKGKLGDRAVAIRTLRMDQKTDKIESKKLFCKESITWMNLSHPNILELMGVDIDPQTGRYSMISELMVNGNLRDYIHHNSVNRHRLLKEAAAGLCYLHQYDIVHGDLKGANILITNDTPPRACLADFGLSTLAPSTQGVTITITSGGTPFYMAPELLLPARFNKTSAQPTKAADIYAFGMVIFEVLTGSQPFYGMNFQVFEIVFHVVDGGRPKQPDDAEQIGFGDRTWELVEECWNQKSEGRPTIERVLAHLTRVAARSQVISPTPEVPHTTPAFDSSSAIRLPQPITASSGDITILADRLSTSATIGTTSTTSTIRTANTSTVSTPIPNKNGESSRYSRKSPFKHSMSTRKLLVKPEQMLHSTIPLPFLFAKKQSRFDRLRHGFFDDLRTKPRRALGPSAPTLQAR